MWNDIDIHIDLRKKTSLEKSGIVEMWNDRDIHIDLRKKTSLKTSLIVCIFVCLFEIEIDISE